MAKTLPELVVSRRSTRRFTGELLGVPDHYGILNVVSLGVRKDPTEGRHVEAMVHVERY